MHSNTLSLLTIAAVTLAGVYPAFAQDRDHDHDWNRASHLIEKTQEDLRRVQHHDAWAVPDRGHYEAAERNLADVRHDLDENRLDRPRLDQAISEVEHISKVNALNREVRDRLCEDLRELRRLEHDWHWR
jgi:hypothetical protein